MRVPSIKTALLALVGLMLSARCFAAGLDDLLLTAMRAYKVPVAGYAIINHGRVVRTKTLSTDPQVPVDAHTLFQAASISKSLTAYAALLLVAQGRLSLTRPANDYLKRWKIPPSRFTRGHPVHVANLMDMTSGLTVSGFGGYPRGQPLPSALQLLEGKPPANNAPVHVFYRPGSRYFYSGGSFQVLEQVIAEVTQQNFNVFMNSKVLKPLQMRDSVFQYPLRREPFLSRAVSGYDGWTDKPIPGGWRNYKCAGACGMWSTPRDLDRFLLNVTRSLRGKTGGLLPEALIRKMLTRHMNTDFGLGVIVAGHGRNLYFWKAGHNLGYHSLIIMFPNRGKGLAIMTNSETGTKLIAYAVALVAHDYHWPYYFPFFDELIKTPDY